MLVAAVRVAKQVDGPVKVVWTREEDIRHDVYRPAFVAWKYKVADSSVMARWLPPAFQKGIDIDALDSAVDMPYDIPNLHVEYVRAEPKGVVTGFWRGVGPNNNLLAIESSMDELARKAGKGPVEFRRGMLGKNPRALAALSFSPPRNPAGARRCRRGSGAAFACNPRSQSSSRPSWRRKSTNLARCICAASRVRSIPALRSIRTRSRRTSRAG